MALEKQQLGRNVGAKHVIFLNKMLYSFYNVGQSYSTEMVIDDE